MYININDIVITVNFVTIINNKKDKSYYIL